MDHMQSGDLRYDYAAWRLLKEGLLVQAVSKKNTPGWKQYRMYYAHSDNPIDWYWNMELHDNRYYLGMNEFEMEAVWYILNVEDKKTTDWLIQALSAVTDQGYTDANGKFVRATRRSMGILRLETLRRGLAPLVNQRYIPRNFK